MAQNIDLANLDYNGDKLLIPKEVIKLLGISESTLSRMIKRQTIKPVILDRRTYRYWLSDIEAYEQNKI